VTVARATLQIRMGDEVESEVETVGTEPKVYAWIVPGEVAVAERPGGGGASHRRDRRQAEQDWWRSQGVRAIVSGMQSRHGLVEYALDGFVIAWHPLTEVESVERELPPLVAAVLRFREERPDDAVLVHVDRPNQWLAGVDGALRIALGVAPDPAAALAGAGLDGLPLGPLAAAMVNTARAPAGV